MARLRRRRLDYRRCSVEELHSFCEQRGVARKPRDQKDDLIAALQAADERRAFPRLFDLPAELRLHIYRAYLEEFDAKEDPTPPPITDACRLLRQETLPVYYGDSLLQVEIHSSFDRRMESEHPYLMSKVFRTATSRRLAKVRMLHIHAVHHAAYTAKSSESDATTRWTFRLDLRRKARFFGRITGACATTSPTAREEAMRRKVCRSMCRALAEVLGDLKEDRSGKFSLEKGDDIWFREAWMDWTLETLEMSERACL